MAVLVGPGAEIGGDRHGAIDHAGDRQAQGPQGAGASAQGGADLLFRRHAQGNGHLGQLFGLDGVEFVIAAYQQGHQWGATALGRGHHQGLDRVGDGLVELLHQFLDGPGPGGGDQTLVLGGRRQAGRQGQGLRQLDVGGIVAHRGEGDGVLAGLRQDMKFMGGPAADGARIRLDGAEIQAAALEDAAVGGVHHLVGLGQGVAVQVEGVGVLHEEFPRPHDPEAGPDLVAELGLDLVEVHRQLLVAAQFPARQVGDDLLVGGAEAEFPLVAILDAQQLGTVLLPAPGLLPQLRRLHRRHQDLQGPGPVHLLPDDPLHLAQDPQSQGQPGIEARRQLADHARPQHQAVTDHLRVRGGLLEGLQGEPRCAHGRGPAKKSFIVGSRPQRNKPRRPEPGFCELTGRPATRRP